MYIKDSLERQFYAHLCGMEHWDTCTLDEKSEGNTEHIEYLMLDESSPIKVAQYYTQLPDKKLLAQKLKKAIAIARKHYQKNEK